MTKLVCLIVVSCLTVGCAAEQGSESDDSSVTYDSMQKLDLLAGDLPEPMQSASERESLDLDTQRALYEFAKSHERDARPWLLLARDAMRSETYGFAVRYYRSAIKADARAIEQQGLLGDVLQVVRVCASATEQKEASQLIVGSYGVEAAEAVNEALVLAIAQQDDAGAERLRVLQAKVDEASVEPVLTAPPCFAKACPATAE